MSQRSQCLELLENPSLINTAWERHQYIGCYKEYGSVYTPPPAAMHLLWLEVVVAIIAFILIRRSHNAAVIKGLRRGALFNMGVALVLAGYLSFMRDTFVPYTAPNLLPPNPIIQSAEEE